MINPWLQQLIFHLHEMTSLLLAATYYLFGANDKAKGGKLLDYLQLYIDAGASTYDQVASFQPFVRVLRGMSSGPYLELSTLGMSELYFYMKVREYTRGEMAQDTETGLPSQLRQLFLHLEVFSSLAEDVFGATSSNLLEQDHFLNYLNGLYRARDFKLLIEEYVGAHLLGYRENRSLEIMIAPVPDSPNEAGLRLMLLPNEKNVVFALNLFGIDTLYGYLSSTTAHFRKLVSYYADSNPYEEVGDTIAMMFTPKHPVSSLPYKTDPFGVLWDISFGSRIEISFSEDGKTIHEYGGMNLNQVFRQYGVDVLKVNVSSWLHSLPLSAAYDRTSRKYAIEQFDLIYQPDWIIPPSKRLGNGKKLVVSDQFQANLPFLMLELKFLRSLLGSDLEELPWNNSVGNFESFRDRFMDLIQENSSMQFLGHGNNALFFARSPNLSQANIHDAFIHETTGEFTIPGFGPYSIEPQEFASLSLSNSEIFLNCCYGSRSSHLTMLEDGTLANSFLLGGASTVLCSTNPIDDYNAFRFGSRISELQVRDGLDLRTAYRKTCQESIEGILPTYLEFIEKHASKSVFVQALHQASRAESFQWQSYILWECEIL